MTYDEERHHGAQHEYWDEDETGFHWCHDLVHKELSQVKMVYGALQKAFNLTSVQVLAI